LVDPYTQAHLRELRMRLDRQVNDAVKTAGELCDCPNCIEARIKNTIPPCELNRIVNHIRDNVIRPNPSNFHPELSPNYFDFNPRMSRKAF
jgi:hypothetical protein